MSVSPWILLHSRNLGLSMAARSWSLQSTVRGTGTYLLTRLRHWSQCPLLTFNGPLGWSLSGQPVSSGEHTKVWFRASQVCNYATLPSLQELLATDCCQVNVLNTYCIYLLKSFGFTYNQLASTKITRKISWKKLKILFTISRNMNIPQPFCCTILQISVVGLLNAESQKEY